jgi:hypothetical protein
MAQIVSFDRMTRRALADRSIARYPFLGSVIKVAGMSIRREIKIKYAKRRLLFWTLDETLRLLQGLLWLIVFAHVVVRLVFGG